MQALRHDGVLRTVAAPPTAGCKAEDVFLIERFS